MINDDVFSEWLDQQIKERKWTHAEFARRAHVSRATVSKTTRQLIVRPSVKTCQGFAKALGLPEDIILHRAGWLPGQSTQAEPSPAIAELVKIFVSLSSRSQTILLGIAQVVHNNDG